jgi:hypothetical protein
MLVVPECGCDRWRREGRRPDQSSVRAYLAISLNLLSLCPHYALTLSSLGLIITHFALTLPSLCPHFTLNLLSLCPHFALTRPYL